MWRDSAHGTAILVPHGLGLSQRDGHCLAESASGLEKQIIFGVPPADSGQIKAPADAAERALIVPFGTPFSLPGTSAAPDVMPLGSRFNGLSVAAHAAYRTRQETTFGPMVNKVISAKLFAPRVEVGILAIDQGIPNGTIDCEDSPPDEGCRRFCRWFPFILATWMSTFSRV